MKYNLLKFGAVKSILGMFIFSMIIISSTHAQSDSENKLDESLKVLTDLQKIKEETVPPVLLEKAEAVIIIPKLKKGGFVVGGKHGKGVAFVRTENGDWSDPVFVKITGGSIGFQVGYSSLDLFLIVRDANTLRRLAAGKGTFTLGGDATVAAGPVGRQASAHTDLDFEAEILSYSKSRGIFAGISMEGSDLRLDKKLNADCYGNNKRAKDILKNSESGETAERLKRKLLMLESE